MAIGDFNTCRAYLDEAGATDATARFMDEVQTAGFRIDHTFLSSRLANRTVEIHYEHEARNARVSDHSMLVLDLR